MFRYEDSVCFWLYGGLYVIHIISCLVYTMFTMPTLISDELMESGTVCCPLSKFFYDFKNHESQLLQAKEEEGHWDCFKSQHLWWWECISAHGMILEHGLFQGLPPMEMCGALLSSKYNNGDPGLLSKSCIKQGRKNVTEVTFMTSIMLSEWKEDGTKHDPVWIDCRHQIYN